MSLLVTGSPVTIEDLVDAARHVLRLHQNPSYVAWRTTRWWNDEVLAAEVARARRAWRFDQHSLRFNPDFDTVFSLPVSQDILLAGLETVPLAVISSLDQLGVHHKDSPDADFVFAFGLLERPAIFDAIRLTGFPLGEGRIAVKVLGEDGFRLMHAAGMSAAEILDATYAGAMPDEDMLRTLVALRASPIPN